MVALQAKLREHQVKDQVQNVTTALPYKLPYLLSWSERTVKGQTDIARSLVKVTHLSEYDKAFHYSHFKYVTDY